MDDFPTVSYLDEQGSLSSSFKQEISKDVLIKGYQTMVLTRLVDERMITLQRQGVITFAMSALGEEACAVASAAALEPQDWLYPQYRESGIMFWRGFTIEQYIHQMFGDAKDLTLGRQMPNHFGSRSLNVVTVSSPIATQIPHAAGCAYAMKLQKESAIAVAYFGEGATSEGDFHTGINIAAVRKAPALFFCRNNGYAISTPCDRQFACEGIAPKSIGYGMSAFRVDGNDFFAIYDAVKQARQQCLEGRGPVLLEAMTYRMGAHSTSDDPSLYRQDNEVEKWKSRCPILRLGKYLEKQGWWSEKQEQEFKEEVLKDIQEAIDIAKATPKPPLRSLVESVYFAVQPSLEEDYQALMKEV